MSTPPGENLPIGRLLVERGVVSLAAVEEAAQSAVSGDSRLCSRLLAAGACDERVLAAALGERHGIPGVDLSRSVVDLAAVDLVPRSVAEADVLLPLSVEGERVHLAVDLPKQAVRVIDEVRFVTGREVSVYVAVLSALRAAITGCYDAREQGAAVWRGSAAPAASGPVIAECAALPPVAPAAKAPGEPGEAASEQVVHAVTVAAGRRKILVVDDEPAIRLLAQRALDHHGFEVETAADGMEALEKLRGQRFDLVLLDAMLPKLHGFELARRLRSDPATRGIAVVMMSAIYRGWRFAQDARQSYGVQDYVEKPFRVDDLLRRVEAALAADHRSPDSAPATAVVERARAAFTQGRLDEAATTYAEAIATDPFSADAHHGLGEVLRLQGDAFRAMTELERAIELDPERLPALRMLAALYLQKGFRAKSAEVLERAVAVASDPRVRDQLRRELMRLL
jgi:CheY-like chemotaxis protein